jgi:DNA-directed RNA polymerase specialized sigma subunit
MSQEIHLNREKTEEEFANFIDFDCEEWSEETCVWRDRRYRMDTPISQDTRYPWEEVIGNSRVKDPTFYRR